MIIIFLLLGAGGVQISEIWAPQRGRRHDIFRLKINHLNHYENVGYIARRHRRCPRCCSCFSHHIIIIFITGTFIQLRGLFKQVLAGGEALNLYSEHLITSYSSFSGVTVVSQRWSPRWVINTQLEYSYCKDILYDGPLRDNKDAWRGVTGNARRFRQTIHVCLPAVCEHAAHQWFQTASRSHQNSFF